MTAAVQLTILVTPTPTIGKGLLYLPAAASHAAVHKGKLKNIREAILREIKEERNPGVVVLQVENETLTVHTITTNETIWISW